jgi:Zn-dependent protease with chaperone function
LLFLARDLSGLFVVNPGPLATAAWGVITVFFLAGIYPSLASSIWRTMPLPSADLQAKMFREADSRRLARIPVRAWLTNQQVINGVVIGLFPWNRKVLLTDGLLQQFDEREVMAIFRHELGHVAGGHMWIRMLILVAPVLLFCLVFAIQGSLGPDGHLPETISNWCSLALALMLVFLFWLMIASPVFRRCEILADRFAVQDERGIPSEELADDYCSAMLKMAALNPHQWERGTIMHPSLRSRVEAVYRHALPHLAKHGDCRDIG